MFLYLFSKNLIDQFAFAHGIVHGDVQVFAHLAQPYFIHFRHINARVLLNGLKHAQALVRPFELDFLPFNLNLGLAVQGCGNGFNQRFDHVHHPLVVFVGHVDFHTGKLGVVGAVHPFISEHFTNFIHPIKTTYNQSFEVQLIGNAQIQRHVQAVVVGLKRPSSGTSMHWLQNGGFYLKPAPLIKILAHGTDELCPLDKDLPHFGVDGHVYIALAVPQFGIGESIVHIALIIALDHRQDPQGFAQKDKFLDMDRDFSHFGAKHIAFDPNVITEVQPFFDPFVVKIFVFTRTEFIPLDEELDASGGVLDFSKGHSAFTAFGQKPPSEHHGLEYFGLFIIKSLFYGGSMMGHLKFLGGIGVDAQVQQSFEVFHSGQLLVVEGAVSEGLASQNSVDTLTHSGYFRCI